MKRMKVLGVLALSCCMMVQPLTVKAEYRIADNGFELEAVTPKGATGKENSYGERETYDKNGNVTTYVTASGRVANYQYDAKGNMISEEKVGADGLAFETTKIVYDETGRPVCETDETGYALYQYTYQGNVVQRTSTVSIFEFERWTYDGANFVRIYEDGFRTYTYDYDANGRVQLLKETAPDGYVCNYEYQYDQNGNVISMHQYDTHNYDKTYTYINEYDGKGRLISITEPEKNVITRYQY